MNFHGWSSKNHVEVPGALVLDLKISEVCNAILSLTYKKPSKVARYIRNHPNHAEVEKQILKWWQWCDDVGGICLSFLFLDIVWFAYNFVANRWNRNLAKHYSGLAKVTNLIHYSLNINFAFIEHTHLLVYMFIYYIFYLSVYLYINIYFCQFYLSLPLLCWSVRLLSILLLKHLHKITTLNYIFCLKTVLKITRHVEEVTQLSLKSLRENTFYRYGHVCFFYAYI